MCCVNNVLGTPLEVCCTEPLTGFYRDGICRTGADDTGTHIVCARVTAAFLEFSRAQGNDLVTPRREFRFSGLKPGDCWCLCVLRWREALLAGVAPSVRLERTHEAALGFVTLSELKAHEWRADA